MHWNTIRRSGKLNSLDEYIDEVLKQDPDEKLLISSDSPLACTLLRLVGLLPNYPSTRDRQHITVSFTKVQEKTSIVKHAEAETTQNVRQYICEPFRLPMNHSKLNGDTCEPVQFLIINRLAGGKGWIWFELRGAIYLN